MYKLKNLIELQMLYENRNAWSRSLSLKMPARLLCSSWNRVKRIWIFLPSYKRNMIIKTNLFILTEVNLLLPDRNQFVLCLPCLRFVSGTKLQLEYLRMIVSNAKTFHLEKNNRRLTLPRCFGVWPLTVRSDVQPVSGQLEHGAHGSLPPPSWSRGPRGAGWIRVLLLPATAEAHAQVRFSDYSSRWLNARYKYSSV